MRIGVWCDYGFTLAPNEGIGVFVDNLVRGILEASSTCTITLKCSPRDSHVVDGIRNDSRGRVSVVCGTRPPYWERNLRKVCKRLKPAPSETKLSHADHGMASRVDSWLSRRHFQRMEPIIGSCDVWLVPYVGLDMIFSKPTVTVVHDLVSYHFPEMLSKRRLDELMRTVRKLVDSSTYVCCMSHFIKENDILGILGVPTEAVRVLKPAVPTDLRNHIQNELSICLDQRFPFLSSSRYLLYPAAFRSYKNHELLIKVLSSLKQRGEADWKVVFTGISNCPDALRSAIDRLNCRNDVHILGRVSREDLSLLYRHAFATLVPSRYEQGSFPVMEAIANGCPAITSDIPALREQFAMMGDTMLYASPDSVDDWVDRLDQISARRDAHIEDQETAFQPILSYSWGDAASSWLRVFEEAIQEKYRIGERRQESLESITRAIAS